MSIKTVEEYRAKFGVVKPATQSARTKAEREALVSREARKKWKEEREGPPPAKKTAEAQHREAGTKIGEILSKLGIR